MLRLLGAREPEVEGPPRELPSANVIDPLGTLAKRAAVGDATAEQTLLIAVGPAVLGVVRRVLGAHHPEVDDVCQEAALGLLSALPSFRGECSVLHFACRVAVLSSLGRRRKSDHESVRAANPEALDGLVDSAPSPAEVIDASRRREALRRLLDELSLRQAEVLTLHVVLGYTVEETAVLTGVASNTVRSRLRRGLDALRDEFGSNTTLCEVVGETHE